VIVEPVVLNDLVFKDLKQLICDNEVDVGLVLSFDDLVLQKELEEIYECYEVKDLRVTAFVELKDLLRFELNLILEQEVSPAPV
jgi:hypothetical protein